MQQSACRPVVVLDDYASSTKADGEHARDPGLRMSFRRLPILAGAVVVVAVIATTMLTLHGDGVTLASFAASDKNDGELKRLLDFYNSVSGSIGSFVGKPVDLFVGLLVSAAFLCFATDLTLARGTSGRWRYASVLSAAGLAYLFSNGLNSLNVQVVPGSVIPRIAAADLAFAKSFPKDQPAFANGSLSTTWDSKFAESARGNSVLNTILRSKLLPFEIPKSPCTGEDVDVMDKPIAAVPAVSFGFESQTWQIETLAHALEPVRRLRIDMKSNASKLKNDSRLPPMPVSVANNLALFGAEAINTNLQWSMEYVSVSPKPRAPSSKPLRVADYFNLSSSNSTRSFVAASHAFWATVFTSTPNVTVGGASAEYARINISDKITFDALTIELPFAGAEPRSTESDDDETVDAIFPMKTSAFCSRDGCVAPSTLVSELSGLETTIQPQVLAVGICVNDDGSEDLLVSYALRTTACARTSNHSMLILSIGSRIEGDVWDKTQSDRTPAMIQSAKWRSVYSITVGRLSWETENLAQAFGAECANPTGCDGLRFKMQSNSSTSDYLIVGNSSLPVADLDSYDQDFPYATKWRSLLTAAVNGVHPSYDTILPRRFSQHTANGTTLRTIAADECNSYVNDYLNTVEKNHLYMEQSLQPAYTAAFYYLFQNAVRRKALESPAASAAAAPSLEFAGNVKLLKVQVSVPNTNAIVSLIGCFMLIVASLGIVCLAKRSEHLLQQRANAEVVMEAMVDGVKYPPWLLKMELAQVTSSPESIRFLLQEFRVQSLVLRHREESKHAFHVGVERDRAAL